MIKVDRDPFSNGTEAMLFEEACCGKCIKGSFLVVDDNGEPHYTNADKQRLPRCRIQRDILLRSVSPLPINLETAMVCDDFVTKGIRCPRMQTRRPIRRKKADTSIQLSLNL